MEKLGQIGWIDLTVTNAEDVRDFYEHVTGWTASPVAMDGYQDYCMTPPGGELPVAGICHARGANAGPPPVWMIYITVADLEESIRRCLDRGGKLRIVTCAKAHWILPSIASSWRHFSITLLPASGH